MAAFQYDDVSLSFYSLTCLFICCLCVFFLAVLRVIFTSKLGKLGKWKAVILVSLNLRALTISQNWPVRPVYL